MSRLCKVTHNVDQRKRESLTFLWHRAQVSKKGIIAVCLAGTMSTFNLPTP